MKAGDAFSFFEGGRGWHTYVVISNPQIHDDVRFPGFVFAVMFSSREDYKEDVCVLYKGDHQFVRHETVVVYKTPPAIFEPLAVVQKRLDLGDIKRKPPVSGELLEKIRKGYILSRYQRDDIFQFLYRQGAIYTDD